jgi:hypothetical protein
VSDVVLLCCCCVVLLYIVVSQTRFIVVYTTTGTTRPGKLYEMKWTDSHKNVPIRHVDRPNAISKFFEQSNTIDNLNQLHQGQLALEKCWVIQYCWFCLRTKLVRINTMDTFCMVAHHKLIPKGNYPITEFAGVLSQQLITHAKAIESPVVPRNLHSSLPKVRQKTLPHEHLPCPLQSNILSIIFLD